VRASSRACCQLKLTSSATETVCAPELPGLRAQTGACGTVRSFGSTAQSHSSAEMRAQSRGRCSGSQACMLRDRHACSATVSLRQRTPPRLVRRRVPVPDRWNDSDAVMRPAADAPDPSPCCAEEALQTGEIWLGAEEALLCVEVRSAAAKRHSHVEAALQIARSDRRPATPPRPPAPLSSAERCTRAAC
jgi:hypothetical protein